MFDYRSLEIWNRRWKQKKVLDIKNVCTIKTTVLQRQF